MSKLRIGILGFGNLGYYLVDNILNNPDCKSLFELAFVQNRSKDKIQRSDLSIRDEIIFGSQIGEEIHHLIERDGSVDLIVEVSHPDVILEKGRSFIENSDLFITSLTALSEPSFRDEIREMAVLKKRKIFIPTGAGWGFADIHKMALANTLTAAHILMSFNGSALRLPHTLAEQVAIFMKTGTQEKLLIKKGSVSEIAKIAPNNVNTMCGLELAASNIGFELVTGELWAVKSRHNHVVDIHIEGPDGFHVRSRRSNPAIAGAVTGNMTYQSFLSSLIKASETENQTGFVFV